jgi:hypothetical protein
LWTSRPPRNDSDSHGGLGDVAHSGLCGGCLLVDLELMDVQAVDLELLDLEVSDHRSPDRKPANGQGADGTGTNGRCADHGRAEASRSKLHRGPLLPAGTEPRLTGWSSPCGHPDAAAGPANLTVSR